MTYAEVGRVTISDGGVAPDSAVLKTVQLHAGGPPHVPGPRANGR